MALTLFSNSSKKGPNVCCEEDWILAPQYKTMNRVSLVLNKCYVLFIKKL